MSSLVKQVLRGSLIALALSLIGPAFAAADAPDPIIASSTGTVTVNADGSRTVHVHGRWQWTTHGSNCNNDRAGVGVAVDWNDNEQPGNPVGASGVDVGVLSSNFYNPADNIVHPAEPGTDIADLANWTQWRSTCGTFPSPGGNFNTGTWGVGTYKWGINSEQGLTHKYSPTFNQDINICALMYDVHGNGANTQPSSQSFVTAGGNSRNDDNSIEKNRNTPLGNGCFSIKLPTLTTNAGGTGTVGSPITDTAELRGATAGATGTITFNLYGPTDGQCQGAPLFTATAPVNGNGFYSPVSPANSYVPTLAGTYHWIANYGGDTNNSGTANGCNAKDENVVVDRVLPKVDTTAGADVTLGSPLQDAATLSGGVSPTGTITFQLFGPNNDSCTGVPLATSTATVNGNGPYGSQPFTPTAAGTYRWIANYSGDTNNKPTTNGCNGTGENVVVKPPPPPPPGCVGNCGPPPPDAHIAIVKTGPATANAGDAIPYNLDVTNPGPQSFAAANVTLTDALCGATPTLVSKNGDPSEGTLDPGDRWSYTCSVPTTLGQTFVHNVASVCGLPPQGAIVCDDDDADTVLAQQAVAPLLAGVSRLRGPTGCIAARTHVLTVTGRRIARVSFYLDGRYIGTRTRPNRGSSYTLTVRGARLARGSHVALAKVTYLPDTNPQTRTLTLAFARCARAVTPKFTG